MWWSQNAKIHLNIHADNYDLHYKGLLAIIVVMKQFEPGEYCRFHRQYVWYMLIVEMPNSNKINSLMCYVEEHEEAPKTTHVWQGKKNLQRIWIKRTVIPFKFFVKSPWCKYKERRSLDCRGQRSQKSENQKLRIKTSSQIPVHNTHLKASQDKEAKRLGIWYLVNWPFQESVMTNWENILYFRTLTLSRTCLGWQPWEGRDNNNKEATWGQDSALICQRGTKIWRWNWNW